MSLGRWSLVVGRWRWSLVVGRWSLVVGDKKSPVVCWSDNWGTEKLPINFSVSCRQLPIFISPKTTDQFFGFMSVVADKK